MKEELTSEQSQHLIELGVPAEKATSIEQVPDYDNPIFRLTDLLEILQKYKKINKPLTIKYDVCEEKWSVSYAGLARKYRAEELIDALYQLAVQCVNGGFLEY